MSIGAKLEFKLNKKTYPPSSRIDDIFYRKDITMITNESGEPVELYIGRRKENGQIIGEKYERRLKVVNGVKKIHWDNKGKISGR